MNFFKRRGPVLMFVFVLAICGALIAAQYAAPRVSEDVQAVHADREKVERVLSAGNVASEYPYSPEHAAEINAAESLKRNVARSERAPENSIGTFVAYPQPMRPAVVVTDEPAEKPRFAKLGELSNLKAVADHGRVYVVCDLPEPHQLEMMEAVRIEIFRGRAGGNIDMAKPYGVIELASEQPRSEKKTGDAKPVEERKRGDEKKAPPAPFKLPERMRVFRDTQVEAQKEYSYMARLVARFNSVEGKREIITTPDATKTFYVLHAPQNATPVVPANLASQSKLYATPLTGIVRATTPTNFELRMAGINGTVPDKPRAPNQLRTGYTVNFELRVWITELQQWKIAQIREVAEGETLGGKLTYRAKGAAETTVYDFTRDLGLILLEVNQEEMEADLAGIRVKMKTEVARIEDQNMKKVIRFSVTRRTDSGDSNPLDKIFEEQTRELEKKKQ